MKKLLFLILSTFLATNLKSFVVELNDQETINLHEESFLENQAEELPATILEAFTREDEISNEEESITEENQNESNSNNESNSDSNKTFTVTNGEGQEIYIPVLNI